MNAYAVLAPIYGAIFVVIPLLSYTPSVKCVDLSDEEAQGTGCWSLKVETCFACIEVGEDECEGLGGPDPFCDDERCEQEEDEWVCPCAGEVVKMTGTTISVIDCSASVDPCQKENQIKEGGEVLCAKKYVCQNVCVLDLTAYRCNWNGLFFDLTCDSYELMGDDCYFANP